MPNAIGYRWLLDHYGLMVTQPLRVQTVIGPSRSVVREGDTELRTVQEGLRPEATLAGHLAFALKHEGVHLEALSRLFAAAPPKELTDWIRREPTGQYARRAGFFCELLTQGALDVPDTTRGNYVEAIDSERELTAAIPINNSRWRVRDNLLGDARFHLQRCRTYRATGRTVQPGTDFA
jgi:predicted transcriptional regulator of viral defense system